MFHWPCDNVTVDACRPFDLGEEKAWGKLELNKTLVLYVGCLGNGQEK